MYDTARTQIAGDKFAAAARLVAVFGNTDQAEIGEAIGPWRLAPLGQIAAAIGVIERPRVVAGAQRGHHIAALAEDPRLGGRAGGGPDRRMRLLPDPWPDIDLAIIEILALPVEHFVVG